jgi:Transposase DDE domain
MACGSEQPAKSSAAFSDSAIELCLTLKVLFGLALRQVTGLVASLLKLAKLDWPVPDYTTLCRRQKTLTVALGGRASSGGLHLLVDSTGIKMTGEGEWKTRKHGASYRRQWRKVHLGIDAETLDIRAIEVTTNAIGDAPILPALLAQIPTNERITTVGGDGAYDTKKCHAVIARRNADAVIPVRRNGQPWKEDGSGTEARNETLRAIKRLGRTIWKKWSGYHRRSLVEAKMHCFKLLGQRVVSRTFDRQITELKIRAAVLNRFSQIGTPTTIRVA